MANRRNQFIQFPDNDDFAEISPQFFNIAGFPGVIGAIDGTHIPILAPSEFEETFVIRKNNHSINTQVCCNSNYELTNVVAKWPGSTHDARILRESTIAEEFETGMHRGLLLGDSGYPSKNWFMVPFLHPRNRADERYNVAHKRTRSIVQRTIGIWKRRFACLSQKIHMRPTRTCSFSPSLQLGFLFAAMLASGRQDSLIAHKNTTIYTALYLIEQKAQGRYVVTKVFNMLGCVKGHAGVKGHK